MCCGLGLGTLLVALAPCMPLGVLRTLLVALAPCMLSLVLIPENPQLAMLPWPVGHRWVKLSPKDIVQPAAEGG